MRKLNNKGFAIASILYSIMVLFLLLLLSILGILGNRKAILDKNKKDILDKINKEILYGVLENRLLGKGYLAQLPDFSNAETNNNGLFQTIDNDGKSYYYRGNVKYNYVSFANKIWRIIRINGDRSIRLILDGDIGSSKFNAASDLPKYSGYTYDRNTSKINSTIYDYLANWYNDNLSSYDEYIVLSKYCNDTSIYEGEIDSFASTGIKYDSISRLQIINQPNLICETTNSNYGGQYLLKIGLITTDELVMAGGYYNTDNMNYYLYYPKNWWTMTPSEYNLDSTCSSVDVVNDVGSYNSRCTDNSNYVVRPVISIKGDVVVSGTGTKNNPYRIKDLD